MGHYTEFVFGVSLLSTTPKIVLNALDYLVNKTYELIELELPDHEFFNCSRFQSIAVSSSYYFGYSESNGEFYIDPDSITKEYLLTIRSNLKNYDKEIEKFVDWIRPYVSNGSGCRDLLGYMLYEQGVLPYMFYKDDKFEQTINSNINAVNYIEELY